MARTVVRRGLVASELLDQAATLFALRGYGGTSLQDIADAMGVSRPSLYRYVRNKDDVLAALVSGLTKDAAASLAKVREQSDLDELERLRAAIYDMAYRVATKPVHFRVLVLSEADLPRAIAPAHSRARREVLDHLLALVRDAITAGFLRPVDEHVAVFSILGTVNWIAWWYKPEGVLSPEELAEQLASLALDGLQRTLPAAARREPEDIVDNIRQELDLLERHLRTRR